tara:strand:- start:1418 stop:2344 length:927 start_codon:yes stop_codon:yes gene_type:complete
VFEFREEPYFLVFLIVSIFYFAFYSFDSYIPYYNSKLDFKNLNINYIVRDILKVLGVLIGIYFGASFDILLLIFIASVSFSNIIFVFNIFKKKSKTEKIPLRKINLFKNQTLFLSFLGLFYLIRINIDKVLIANFISFENLAIYSIGILVGTNINSFFKIFLTTINAKLVYKELNKFHYLLLFLFGSFIGLTLSFVIIPPIFKIVYGEIYMNGLIFTQVILCSLGFLFLKTVYYNSNLFNKKSMISKIYKNNVISPIIVMFYMLFIFLINVDKDILLLLLSFTFTFEYIVNIIVLFLINNKHIFRWKY